VWTAVTSYTTDSDCWNFTRCLVPKHPPKINPSYGRVISDDIAKFFYASYETE